MIIFLTLKSQQPNLWLDSACELLTFLYERLRNRSSTGYAMESGPKPWCLCFLMQIHGFRSSPIPPERIKMLLQVNYNIRMATFSKHLANNLQAISTIQFFFFHFLEACCEVQQDDSSSQVPFYRQMENWHYMYTLSLSSFSLCLILRLNRDWRKELIVFL